MLLSNDTSSTICALSTPPGVGAIGVIRISGAEAFSIMDEVFSKKTSSFDSHTSHFGTIKKKGRIIDEVVITVFKGKKSFTGEDTIEISCHGSTYIQQQILQLLIEKGASTAKPGEFSMRAFLNGKMDLSQTEAVADLIASSSEAAHKLAMQQMRGGFSKEINKLREELVHFASLIELELDFSEEDVEFADRNDLKELVDNIQGILKDLIDSFAYGNAIKNGIPVVIVGAPNVGKSTLLNALLNEERAIVSDIAGTTRDTIEDRITIEGVEFRFIDTAGIRKTSDAVEIIGIERTFDKIEQASVVLLMIDAAEDTYDDIKALIDSINEKSSDSRVIVIANKTDLNTDNSTDSFDNHYPTVHISAKHQQNLDELKSKLLKAVHLQPSGDIVVTNTRHYEALSKANEDLQKVRDGLDSNITGDFLAMDIRQSLYHLGEITGEITTDDLLGNIFSKFCIGK